MMAILPLVIPVITSLLSTLLAPVTYPAVGKRRRRRDILDGTDESSQDEPAFGRPRNSRFDVDKLTAQIDHAIETFAQFARRS